MRITIIAQRSDAALSVSCAGDVLTINGEVFDFGPLPDGCELPHGAVSSPFVVGPVRRDGGVVSIALAFPYAADEEAWEPRTLDLDSGEVKP
ncbi:hypothetical protein [Xanthomonas translucens]|uniref:hypothetical protein n=1 Tax=Xanthomonas campestris pv. translucens TaxID=343 RepID=UPI00071BD2FB|nr:hypothetical protein [Xanthomonas translucens]AVY67157.1 hypothetical protein NZ30_12735 [Xanthomonas translucens pv. undulosa]MCT8281744.1 hypothetical protein [Xanthomonas translucens pv. undulosa]MCT8316502.1 hypothetical protein [Xanthomonas translucens pv. undulosa]QEN93653.1 hypothetical protein F0H33_09920 [Xanthomonas translucens pv. undulosa]QSQ58032.1 hypothetical protein ISN37_08900 [Xanthomonas translucens pv. undulosa]